MKPPKQPSRQPGQAPTLRRSLNLPLVILYGLGVTIGGGIYVLVGHVVGRAGMYAPFSFLLAAILIAFTGLTFAELSSRFPKSAGEAVYVQEGFGRKNLAVIVGWLVVLNGIISSAALSRGVIGYFQTFFSSPEVLTIIVVVVLLAIIAIWGIGESVMVASVITIIEIVGLLLVIWAGREGLFDLPAQIDTLAPPFSGVVWAGILGGSFLAFYAFIGFEDMVNIAEEVKDVQRTMPVAIVVTLCITALLYFLVTVVAVLALPTDELAKSEAPLALIFEKKTGVPPDIISAIGIMAVLNGALIQVIMASRVLYGMSAQGWLPDALGRIHPKTQTPIMATLLVSVVIGCLALTLLVDTLAQLTSFVVLMIAALVNAALWRLKIKDQQQSDVNIPLSAPLNIPMWVPVTGFFISAAFAVMVFVDLLP